MGEHSLKPYGKKTSSAGRVWGFNRISGAMDGKETIYMTRAWLGRLRFHIFHRGDQDPDCHDHPWGFWTFPLRSYVEEVLEERIETRWIPDHPIFAGYDEDGHPEFLEHRTAAGGFEKQVRRYFERRYEVVKAFRWNYRPATYRHRVLGAYAGHKVAGLPVIDLLAAVPTIVWREKPSRDWGFTKERGGFWCWVPWIDYVYHGGKAAPCQDDTDA